MLALGVVLGLVQIVAASHAASLQRGYRWTAGPRDEPPPPLRGVAGRLDRALRNSPPSSSPRTSPIFTTRSPSGGRGSTFWGASPTCRSTSPAFRSLVWNVATVGLMLFVVALLLG
jgi:uncharacterized MAPEG superfamily protein